MKSGKVSVSRARLVCWLFLLPLLLGLRGTAFAQTDLTIYDEALAPGWQDWSWATRRYREHGECQHGQRSRSP